MIASKNSSNGFHRSIFLTDTFNAKTFVENMLLEQDLDSLVQDLHSTVQDLTDQLLALIDRDHQTFLELSGDLVRVDSTVGTLRGPLTHLKDKVEAVKRATSGPAEAIKEFDEKINIIRAKKKALKEKIFSKNLKQNLEKDLAGNEESKAAQRLALLLNVLNEAEASELRREIEHRLSEKLLDTTSSTDLLSQRLRSFVMIGSIETARRCLITDLSHYHSSKDEGTILEHVLMKYQPLFDACSSQGLGTVFEFPSKSIFTQTKLSSGKIVSSKDARKSTAVKQLLSLFSPTGTPHGAGTVARWNPRMHCELRFQDAVQIFTSTTNKIDHSILESSLKKLYEEEVPKQLQQDLLLSSHLFRMACRLVSGYLHFLQAKLDKSEEDASILDNVKESFRLKAEILEGKIINPPSGWDGGNKVLKYLSDRAENIGGQFLEIFRRFVIDVCINELNAHEQAVTAHYRGQGKPFSEVESATASKILLPLTDSLMQLNSPPFPLVKDLNASSNVLTSWVQTIIEEVTSHYLGKADSNVKRENSLLRLHTRSNNTKGTMSDSHKILKQLALDTPVYVTQANSLLDKYKCVNFDKNKFEEIVQVLQAFGDGQ